MCASRKSAGLPFTTAMRSFRLRQASGGGEEKNRAFTKGKGVGNYPPLP